MAVPTQLSDLSATAASNSPAGTDTVGTTMDDFIRAHASIIARISAGTDAMTTPALGAATGTSLVLSGLATVNGAFTSLGLDDNATAKALTLSGSGANSVTIANSATNPTIGTNAGAISFNPVAQGEVLRITTGGASTVNYFSLSGSTTGGRLTLLATGSDTNVGASWQTKGTGSHLFVTETGASAQVEITHTASANQYLTLTGDVSNGPRISVGGAANANLYISAGVGTGSLYLYTNNVGTCGLRVDHVASGNRFVTLTGSNGGNPTIGTSAGSLNLSAAVVCASTLSVSTNAFVTGYTQSNSATATPAGGAVNTGYFLGSAAIGIYFGSGAPTVSAAQGSLYIRTDGGANTRLYSNNNGSTGWSAITSA